MIKCALVFFTFALFAFAGDVTGKWTATVPTRDGTHAVVFDLKQDREALTGKLLSDQGNMDVTDGKIW